MIVRPGTFLTGSLGTGEGSAGGGGYSPLVLSPAGWWDLSDISTLWQDTSATSAVSTAGQSIARINDKSGNVRHMSQSTAANRGTYISGGGVDLDGNDGYSTSAVTLASTGVTFAAVAQLDVAGSNPMILTQGITLGLRGNGTTGRAQWAVAGGACSEAVTTITGTKVLLVGLVETDMTGISLRRNGSEVATSGSTTWTPANDNFFIGQRTGGLYMDGKVYEAIIVNSQLSGTDLSDLEGYLMAKWGIV